MFAIAYISTAVHAPTTVELEALLVDAREFNASVAVTGALILSGATFFQYIEGSEQAVTEVYKRIEKSHLHHDINILFRKNVPERYFEQWHMAFDKAPKSFLLRLTQARWNEDMTATVFRGKQDEPPGVRLLLQFWRNTRRLPWANFPLDIEMP